MFQSKENDLAYPIREYLVRVGSNLINNVENGREFRVLAIRNHPKFIRPSMAHDVAVLIVLGLLEGTNIEPINLYDGHLDGKVDRFGIVSGHGIGNVKFFYMRVQIRIILSILPIDRNSLVKIARNIRSVNFSD